MRSFAWFFLIAFTCLLTACGKQEPPENPILQIPLSPRVKPPKTKPLTVAPPSHNVRLKGVGKAFPKETLPVNSIECLKCHEEATPFVVKTWKASRHAVMGIRCNACHGVHGFDFAARPEPERCRACHGREVEDFQKGRHRNTPQSGTTCFACHPIHDFDLEIARNPLICINCHQASPHVQVYLYSKMGVVYQDKGKEEAAYCQRCHFWESSIHDETAQTRNDTVFDHNVSATIEYRDAHALRALLDRERERAPLAGEDTAKVTEELSAEREHIKMKPEPIRAFLASYEKAKGTPVIKAEVEAFLDILNESEIGEIPRYRERGLFRQVDRRTLENRTEEMREKMAAVCEQCHAKETAISRVRSPDPIIRFWTRAEKR
ncbi:MAG: cytochrome c3 family protein [Armatimonadetes bacterium]|nr:cytochrome c3 family protein [Armatimonadota bacterium]